jgi:AraC-like DNA-binding protein
MAGQGRARIGNLVRKSLSASQFQRRFASEVGVTPKLFARTIRFDAAAITAHHNAPDRSWTDIVHELGYFDQAHFIGECRTFAGVLPSGLVGEWENSRFPAQ